MGNQPPSASGGNTSSSAHAPHMGNIPGNPYGANPPGATGAQGPPPHHPSQQQHPQHTSSQQQSSHGAQSSRGSAGGGGGPPTGGGNYLAPPTGYISSTHTHKDASRTGTGGGTTANSAAGGGGVLRTSSDATMTNVEDSEGGTSSVHTTSTTTNLPIDLSNFSTIDDDTVPTVFRWEHGGRQVYITGTFNGWSRQIPMHRSGNDFTYIHNLKRGKHAFKFIVDDEWRFAPDQPTVADIEGRINNFIDVTDFQPYTGDKNFEREKVAAYYSTKRQNHATDMGKAKDGVVPPEQGEPETIDASSVVANRDFLDPDGEVFSRNMPDFDDYTKEPPPLPPHLRHIILNKPPQLQDTAALPVPQHVALNHLYCTAIKDNMMVLGITQRFKTKFVTTVYYSPELSR